MEKSTLEFSHSSRIVYAAVKNLFEMKRTKFCLLGEIRMTEQDDHSTIRIRKPEIRLK